MVIPYPSDFEIDREAEAREPAFEALKAQVHEEDVAEVIERRLLEIWNERYHPMTQALRDVMANPAESKLALSYIDYLPSGVLLRLGRAWVRLCAESWIEVADRTREVAF